MKVVPGAERRARPDLVQLGDREWVKVIQGICAAGDWYTIYYDLILEVFSFWIVRKSAGAASSGVYR